MNVSTVTEGYDNWCFDQFGELKRLSANDLQCSDCAERA